MTSGFLSCNDDTKLIERNQKLSSYDFNVTKFLTYNTVLKINERSYLVNEATTPIFTSFDIDKKPKKDELSGSAVIKRILKPSSKKDSKWKTEPFVSFTIPEWKREVGIKNHVAKTPTILMEKSYLHVKHEIQKMKK